jgi:DNA-binding NarL/FixJ family response regulator
LKRLISTAVSASYAPRRFVAGHDASCVVGGNDGGVARPTVLIVDDHDAFRGAARSLLEMDGFDVVGEAADGRDALMAIDRLHPEVVLLDIQLPDLDGFVVADRLTAMASAPAVVLISSREAETYGARLAGARVRGFLPKRELSGAALARLLG